MKAVYINLVSICALSLLCSSLLHADSPLPPCYILEQHKHLISPDGQLVACSYNLLEGKPSQRPLWTYLKKNKPGRKKIKHADDSNMVITCVNSGKSYTDTTCKWINDSNRNLLCMGLIQKADTVLQNDTLTNENKILPFIPISISTTHFLSTKIYWSAFLTTLLVETFFGILLFVMFGIPLRYLWIVPLCSVITHPVLCYLQWNSILAANSLLITEGIVIITEAFIIIGILRNKHSLRFALVCSGIMNSASLGIGLMFM